MPNLRFSPDMKPIYGLLFSPITFGSTTRGQRALIPPIKAETAAAKGLGNSVVSLLFRVTIIVFNSGTCCVAILAGASYLFN